MCDAEVTSIYVVNLRKCWRPIRRRQQYFSHLSGTLDLEVAKDFTISNVHQECILGDSDIIIDESGSTVTH
jgi:hypothetical protein